MNGGACGCGGGIIHLPNESRVHDMHGEGLMDLVRGLYRSGKKAAKVASDIAKSKQVQQAVKFGKQAVKVGQAAADIYSSPAGTAIRNLLPGADATSAPAFPGEIHAPLLLPNGKGGIANFMGPGTQVLKRLERGDAPRTPADEVAMMHDVQYRLAQDLKSRDAQVAAQREADKRMVASLDRLEQSRGDHLFNIAQGKLIAAKMLGEDVGVMRKGTFGGPLEDLSQKERDVLTKKYTELEQKGLGHPALKLKLAMEQKFKNKPKKGGMFRKTTVNRLRDLEKMYLEAVRNFKKNIQEAMEFMREFDDADESVMEIHRNHIKQLEELIEMHERRLQDIREQLKETPAGKPTKGSRRVYLTAVENYLRGIKLKKQSLLMQIGRLRHAMRSRGIPGHHRDRIRARIDVLFSKIDELQPKEEKYDRILSEMGGDIEPRRIDFDTEGKDPDEDPDASLFLRNRTPARMSGPSSRPLVPRPEFSGISPTHPSPHRRNRYQSTRLAIPRSFRPPTTRTAKIRGHSLRFSEPEIRRNFFLGAYVKKSLLVRCPEANFTTRRNCLRPDWVGMSRKFPRDGEPQIRRHSIGATK